MTEDKKAIINIVAHTVLDGIAIIGLIVLICLDKIDTQLGLVMIALIVGIWKHMQGSGTLKQPPSGLVAGLGAPLFELFRRFKGFVIPLALITASISMQGCSSTPMLKSINTALNVMVIEINPALMTIQATCTAREWEAIHKSEGQASAQIALLKIRDECNRLYASHEEWIKAYEKVQTAIDAKQHDQVLLAFLGAQSASKTFLKKVNESPIFDGDEI